MQSYCYIFGLFSVMFISVASSDIAGKNSKGAYREDEVPDKSIDKRQGGYNNNNLQNTNQYNVNPYQYDYKGYQDQYWTGQSVKDYDSVERKEAVDEVFTSGGVDRQDLFGGDSAIAIGLAVLAGVAAGVSLAWNTQQPSTSDFDALKTRVASLESDQTSICTAVKSVTNADDGLTTIGGGYNSDSTGEGQYMTNLAAVGTPTCS